MASTTPTTISIYDLVDGTRISGVLVETSGQQLGVFAGWPRPFIWNRPAAATLDVSKSPVWVPLTTVEVMRTHEKPDAGQALVSFGEPFEVEVAQLGPPPDPTAVNVALASVRDWASLLAATYPELRAQSVAEDARPPEVSLPPPSEFAAPDVTEFLGPLKSPGNSWKVCKILGIC